MHANLEDAVIRPASFGSQEVLEIAILVDGSIELCRHLLPGELSHIEQPHKSSPGSLADTGFDFKVVGAGPDW